MTEKVCECGCGQKVRRRFVQGHTTRGRSWRWPEGARRLTGPANPSWRGSQALNETIHEWLRANFPKSGVCEDCGEETKTDYAFLRHPAHPTREREDYRELCVACHRRMDEASYSRDARGRFMGAKA